MQQGRTGIRRWDGIGIMQINEDAVREVLKQHFPEYISGNCLCGEPIETYMAWIDHVAALMFPPRFVAPPGVTLTRIEHASNPIFEEHPETFLDKGETNG